MVLEEKEHPVEYNLKKGLFGPIDPVVRDAHGKIADGLHRKEVDPNWPEVTRKDLDSDRKFWAFRLIRHKRRLLPRSEMSEAFENLAESIKLEVLQGKLPMQTNIVKQIVDDTGYSEAYIRGILPVRGKKESVFKTPYVDRAKKEEVEEELPEEAPPVPAEPSKGSPDFENRVMTTISKYAGTSIENLKAKVRMIHELNGEEAEGFVEKFKGLYPSIWESMYDSRDQPLREAVQEASPGIVTTEFPMETPAQVPEPSKSSAEDPLLSLCKVWYPEDIVVKVWDSAPSRNQKVPLLKAVFTVCWEKANEASLNILEEAVERIK